MRLPWIQITQEAFALARALGGAVGCDRHRAMGLLIDLWSWALEMSPDDEPPTGIVRGSRAGRMLAGAVEWTGEHAELIDTLSDLGIVEVLDDGIRVRGMHRYLDAWRMQRSRSDRASKAAKARWNAGKSGLDAPAMLQPCSSDARSMLGACSGDAPACPDADADADVEEDQKTVAASGSGPALVLVEQGPKKPARKLSTQQEFWAWAQRIRSEDGLLPDEQWPAAKINARLASINGHSRQLIADAYLAFVSDERMKAKGAPMAFFAQDWPRWAERVVAESEVSP